MKHASLLIAFIFISILTSCNNGVVRMQDLGIKPNTGIDVTADFNKALQRCREKGARILYLEKGVYDFWPENAVK